LLCGKRLVEGNADAILDPETLALCFLFSLLPFRREYFSVEAQLSAEDDTLLNKNALLATPERSAPNFVASVSDCWIGPQTRLKCATGCLSNTRLGLAQGWIIRASHL
jgi:hypothetical protein